MGKQRPVGMAAWSPNAQSLAVLQVALDLEDEWPLLVRRVLYVAYERKLYPDKGRGSYNAVGDVLGRARRAGLLPWQAVADTTERTDPFAYEGLEDFKSTLTAVASSYRRNRQKGQPVHLLAWSEHRGLQVTLAETALEYGVPFIASGGFDGHAVRYYEALRATQREVPTVVLHLGDRDTAGEHIFTRLQRDLQAFYRDLGGRHAVPEVVRVALTPEQIAEHALGKPGEAVQVDALPTPVLRAILREVITIRMDASTLATQLSVEAIERQEALDLIARLTPTKRRRHHKVTPELLGQVAEVYRTGDPFRPTEGVASYFDIPYSTASRWIRAARDAGLLEPPPSHHSGGRPKSNVDDDDEEVE